jgi:hypothetical protein
VEHIERRNGGHPHERHPHEGEQNQSVDQGLIPVNQHRGSLTEQGGVDAEHRDGTQSPDDEQHADEYPGSLPRERAGRDEQYDRDYECVGDDSCQYSVINRQFDYLSSLKTKSC